MEGEVLNTAVEVSDVASNIMTDMFGEVVDPSSSELFVRGLEVLREGHPFGEVCYHLGAAGAGALIGGAFGLALESIVNGYYKWKHQKGVIAHGSEPTKMDLSPRKRLNITASGVFFGAVIGAVLSYK